MGTFSFTNTTASATDVTPVAIGPLANYSLLNAKDGQNFELYFNDTCPIDQQEYLRYKCLDVKNVSSLLTSYNPSSVRAGVQYSVRLDELVRNDNTASGGIVTDDPLVMWLTVAHTKSGAVTEANVTEVFKRLIAALRQEDGTWRWNQLAKGGLTPKAD